MSDSDSRATWLDIDGRASLLVDRLIGQADGAMVCWHQQQVETRCPASANGDKSTAVSVEGGSKSVRYWLAKTDHHLETSAAWVVSGSVLYWPKGASVYTPVGSVGNRRLA